MAISNNWAIADILRVEAMNPKQTNIFEMLEDKNKTCRDLCFSVGSGYINDKVNVITSSLDLNTY